MTIALKTAAKALAFGLAFYVAALIGVTLSPHCGAAGWSPTTWWCSFKPLPEFHASPPAF